MKLSGAAAVALLLVAACSTATVDQSEPRRVVGSENAVHVDAEIMVDELRAGTHLPIRYEIRNQRPEAIAIADIVPVTSWDLENQLITVDIGSEVPGEILLPRLVEIGPGETKAFTTSARIAFAIPPASAGQRPVVPSLRLKINFLGDLEPFRVLVGMTEKALADRALADSFFPLWVDRNEVLYTGTVTMRWSGTGAPTAAPVQRRPGTGRGRF